MQSIFGTDGIRGEFEKEITFPSLQSRLCIRGKLKK